MRFDGGKGVCFAQIINLIPPHRRYIETHLGGGAVMRNKKPAPEQIGIDIDPAVIDKWAAVNPIPCKLVNEDALTVLRDIELNQDTVVYVDPPYYPETRRRKKVYRYDYTSDDHIILLDYLCTLKCNVIISGYHSKMYEEKLKGWNIHTFKAKTHVDVREECIWFNYNKPDVLHDSRFLGDNFRDREVIRRRGQRLKNRIRQLSPIEQVAIFEWLSQEINAELLHEPNNTILV